MKIICDSASLFEPSMEEEFGIKVFPLNVTINNKTYKEFAEIDRKTFINQIYEGHLPTSSQPSIGEVLDFFEDCDEETIAITMADGLSGTYQSFVGAKQSLEGNADHIHIINSRTLCGPERLLVLKALKLKDEGCTAEEIIEQLNYSMDRHSSFLIPKDYDFLKRGGRLTPVAATVAGLLKVVPVLQETEDGKRLEKFALKRTFKAAVMDIIDYFKKMNVDENYTISISHADALDIAQKAVGWIQEALPSTKVEVYELSPVFITQGGPGCVSIQVIHN
ncbi:MAG: DegV family protein [Holdemanella sp.]|nr:DegV family protein [Holdemanella sp.]